MIKQPPVSQDAAEATAALIRAIHSADFPDALARFLKTAAQFDYLIVFQYFRDKAPMVLSHDFDTQTSKDSLNTYLSGPYLLDPFFEQYRNADINGAIHLKDIAPDHFFRSEYYRSYYVTTRILDEVSIFVPMPDGSAIVATIERMRGNYPFRKKEIVRYRAIEPIVREAVFQNWGNVEPLMVSDPSVMQAHSAAEAMDALPDRVKNVVRLHGQSALTNRESEVVGLILRGYSSIAIASILDISAATVKVHRKNVYSKLKISSQAELFSLFMPLFTPTAA